MEDYLAALPTAEKHLFSAIADYAFTLGYKAKKDKTNAPGYTFHHSKIKKPVLRFTSSRGKLIIRLKFFATPAYSAFFNEAIRRTIEEYDFRYTGCYGCGRCDGTQGYRYQYADGRQYYRCGSELIEILHIDNLPLEEFLALFKKQHDYYLSS
jgi:hypothetical protein